VVAGALIVPTLGMRDGVNRFPTRESLGGATRVMLDPETPTGPRDEAVERNHVMQMNVHTLESAPARSLPLMERLKGEIGFVPNMAAVIAQSPALLAAFVELRTAVHAGELNAVHREVAGLAVGVAVDNEYGVAFHSTVLDRLGASAEDLDAMRGGRMPSDPVSAIVYELAREVVVGRGKVDAALVDRALAAGLSSADIFEIVAECTFAGLVGVVDNLVDRVALDDFLASRAWRASEAAMSQRR
jgi:alkylhydroperoxidase family enzyme